MEYSILSIKGNLGLRCVHITPKNPFTSGSTVAEEMVVRGGNRNSTTQSPNYGQPLGELVELAMNPTVGVGYSNSVPNYLKAAEGDKALKFFNLLAQNFPHVHVKKNGSGRWYVDITPIPDRSLEDSVLLNIDFHPFARNYLQAEGYRELIQTSQGQYRRQRKDAIKTLIMLALADSKLELTIKRDSYYVSVVGGNSISNGKKDKRLSTQLTHPPDTLEYEQLVLSNLFASEPMSPR